MSHIPCVLRNLDNPLLNGIALGLDLDKNGDIVTSSDIFACCQGLGFAWNAKTACVANCGLAHRMQRLRVLLARYRSVWPHAQRLPQQIPPSMGHPILEELAGVFNHDRPSASLSFSTVKHQPSALWARAFATIWRFGREARILNLEKPDPKSIAAFTANSSRPMALFLEHVDRLWEPMYADAVEYIVQQAYNAQDFLWIEFLQEPELELPSDGSLRSSFSRHIQKLKKNAHPLSHLSADCLSRLRSMSEQSLEFSKGDQRNA